MLGISGYLKVELHTKSTWYHYYYHNYHHYHKQATTTNKQHQLLLVLQRLLQVQLQQQPQPQLPLPPLYHYHYHYYYYYYDYYYYYCDCFDCFLSGQEPATLNIMGYAIPATMPQEALPVRQKMEKHKGTAYTLLVSPNGAQLQVLLSQRAFMILRAASDKQPSRRNYAWLKYGGIQGAWEEAKRQSGHP